jgi:hypothetical protein
MFENVLWVVTMKDQKNDGTGFIFAGGNVDEQRKASASRTFVMTLRPGEPPLGELSVADMNWLTTALTYLIRIDESRRVENVHDNAYCIFEVGRIYFQCLAPPFGTYLRCVSAFEYRTLESCRIAVSTHLSACGHWSDVRPFEFRCRLMKCSEARLRG